MHIKLLVVYIKKNSLTTQASIYTPIANVSTIRRSYKRTRPGSLTAALANFLELHFGSNYTVTVNHRKLIHALLVLTLCYGQLAASMHVVGHLHPQECKAPVNFASANDLAGCIDDSVHMHLTDGHHHNHTSDNNNEENNNCAIYHAVLNLDGTVCAEVVTTSVQDSVNSALFNASQIAGVAPTNKNIRAPPLGS